MFYQLTWNFNHSPLTVEKLSVQHKATATKKEKEYCTIFYMSSRDVWCSGKTFILRNKFLCLHIQKADLNSPGNHHTLLYESLWGVLISLCSAVELSNTDTAVVLQRNEANTTSPSGVYRMKPKMLCMQILSRIHKCWSPRAFAFFAQLLIQPHCS